MTYENRTENQLCIFIRLHRREKKYMSKLKTLLRSIYNIYFSLSRINLNTLKKSCNILI